MIGADIWLPGKFYHIYNRSNGKEILFRDRVDRRFFLKNFNRYLAPIMDVYAYCLMGNHFHILVKVKSRSDLKNAIFQHYTKRFNCHKKNEISILIKAFEFPSIEKYISKQLSNMFNSYSKMFNERHKRKGNLFERPFHRKIVKEMEYLRYLFFYIHVNPIRDAPHETFEDTNWTSYKDVLEGKVTYINLFYVMDFFGSQEHFKRYHENMLTTVRKRNDWLEPITNLTGCNQ